MCRGKYKQPRYSFWTLLIMYFSKCVIDKDELFSQLSLISLISESTSLSILFSNLVKTLHFVSIYNFDKMNFFTNFVNIRVYSLVYFTFQISSKHFTLCQFITLFPTFLFCKISQQNITISQLDWYVLFVECVGESTNNLGIHFELLKGCC
jgi:hypothetical protein